jgi:hypothetical protein
VNSKEERVKKKDGKDRGQRSEIRVEKIRR